MKFSEVYKDKYYDLMKKPAGENPVRDRSDGFLIIFQELEKFNFPFIVETGSIRPDHGEISFGDDGASTYLFDKFLDYNPLGTLYSVDIDDKNTEHANKLTKNSLNVTDDSVNWLWRLPEHKKIDLLYLDSYDFSLRNPSSSWLHQMKEIAAAMKNLHDGSIVVSDDYLCPGEIIGKGKYLEEFLDNIGAELLYCGYQLIYRIRQA